MEIYNVFTRGTTMRCLLTVSEACLAILVYTTKFTEASEFTSTPGVRRTVGTVGSEVPFTWTTNFNTKDEDVSIQDKDGNAVISYLLGGFQIKYGEGYNAGNVAIDVTGMSVTVTLKYPDTSPHTRGNYTCEMTIVTTGGDTVRNSDAVLYTYGVPTRPAVPQTPDTPEGGSVTLTCNSTSTSEPSAYREALWYTWRRGSRNLTSDPLNRHSVTGNQLRISEVIKSDRDHEYFCVAEDGGLTSVPSSVIKLPVMYNPGSALASNSDLGPVTENENSEVELKCVLNDPAYPSAQFYWTRDNVNQTGGQTGVITIPTNEATVSRHDGVWRCTPYNTAGSGGSADITLTVNARIVIKPSLPSPHVVLAHDVSSLGVTCNLKSRPGATLSWTYTGGSLPDGVTTGDMTSDTHNKITTVSQKLMWDPDRPLSARRQAGGEYRCTGTVDLGTGQIDREEGVMDLRVEYYPYNIRFTDGDSHLVVVAGSEIVVRTCAATCSPECTYKWTNSSGTSVSNSSVLRLDPVQKDDHGVYTCEASNKQSSVHKEFNLTVYFSSAINDFRSSVREPTETDRTILTCDVSSRPASDITITYRDNGTEMTSSVGHRAEYTFVRVQCLDTGTYQCTADNNIGSGAGPEELYLNVLCSISPTNIQETIAAHVDQNVTYITRMTANPFPVITNNNWSFIPRIDTRSRLNLPDNVHVDVIDTSHLVQRQVVFRIWSLKVDNFGVYQMGLATKIGSQSLLYLNVTPEAVPRSPRDFEVVRVTAVSITVEWLPGFDGGPDQTFTITYTNTQTGSSEVITAIEDAGPSGSVLRYKIQQAIEDQTQYRIRISAVNVLGTTDGDSLIVDTPAKAKFSGSHPTVTILNKTHASVEFRVTGPLTHINVTNCVRDTPDCVSDNVTVPVRDNQRELTEYTDSITESVALAGDSSDVYTFYFSLYDGEDRLYDSPVTLLVNDPGISTIPVIVGVVVAVVVVAALCITIFIIVRRRRTNNEERRNGLQLQHHTYENMDNQSPKVIDPEVPGPDMSGEYEELGPAKTSQDTQVSVKAIYEGLCPTELPTFSDRDLDLEQLLSEGSLFNVWLGRPKKLNVLPTRFVVKQISGRMAPLAKSILTKYIHSQGGCMWKMKHDLLLPSLGSGSDMILLEYTSLGTLHQHLTSVSDDAYSNKAGAQLNVPVMSYVHQMAAAVAYVYNFQPTVLFYWLSANHVHLYNNNKIKVTGFADECDVHEREKWEHENQMPRPVRWLAPEAINLRHEKKSDVWSLAVLIWEIINFGQQPMADVDDEHVGQLVKNAGHPLKTDLCDSAMYNILEQCWKYAPDTRPTPDVIKTMINDVTQYESV